MHEEVSLRHDEPRLRIVTEHDRAEPIGIVLRIWAAFGLLAALMSGPVIVLLVLFVVL